MLQPNPQPSLVIQHEAPCEQSPLTYLRTLTLELARTSLCPNQRPLAPIWFQVPSLDYDADGVCGVHWVVLW